MPLFAFAWKYPNCSQIVSSCYFLLHQLHSKHPRSVFCVFFCVFFVFFFRCQREYRRKHPSENHVLVSWTSCGWRIGRKRQLMTWCVSSGCRQSCFSFKVGITVLQIRTTCYSDSLWCLITPLLSHQDSCLRPSCCQYQIFFFCHLFTHCLWCTVVSHEGIYHMCHCSCWVSWL